MKLLPLILWESGREEDAVLEYPKLMIVMLFEKPLEDGGLKSNPVFRNKKELNGKKRRLPRNTNVDSKRKVHGLPNGNGLLNGGKMKLQIQNRTYMHTTSGTFPYVSN